MSDELLKMINFCLECKLKSYCSTLPEVCNYNPVSIQNSSVRKGDSHCEFALKMPSPRSQEVLTQYFGAEKQ